MANFLLTNKVLDMLTIFSLLLTFQAISYLMNSLECEFCSFKLQSSNSRLLKKNVVPGRVRAGSTGPSLILQMKIMRISNTTHLGNGGAKIR